MSEYYKEVYFDVYCQKCKHRETKEICDPCNECLGEPVNNYSSKPLYFEEDKKCQEK